ncbi:lipid II:glycine glycyltransferase FemX [Jannaschia rubra]|uniref:N-acetyltransferase domain-containing protein n=1 Tax=Jannaschia rubra TaxID=282197 RepID=A0A0M6XY13_9RHOB|nr:GNAT family N-acetyltransferase [Jannaschia rubra]CTQ34804.1 putative protein involved in methicillin resistance [Jannaschia rubra]SFG80710.1 Lipid II:glycine glycyltransferase (Peptidoglycan interpeptide bridge formation enzyme) [Jannaschia rubra]
MKVLFYEDSSDPHLLQADAVVRTWPSASIAQAPVWPALAAPSRLQSYRFFVCTDAAGEVLSSGCIRLAHLYPGRFAAAFRRGPCTRTPEDLARVMPALEEALRRMGAVSVAVNPHWEDAAAETCEKVLAGCGYARVPPHEQTLPTATALIDVTPSEADLLAGFSQRRRRDLRASGDKAVEVRPVATRAEAEDLSAIMREMAATTGMEIDRQHDFAAHFDVIAARPDLGRINAAFTGGTLLGGSVTYREGRRAYALLVATSPAMRGGGRSTALYWQNILDAKRLGCSELDLVGYPDPRLAEAGQAVGRQEFKESFRPRIATLPPIMSRTLRPLEARIHRRLRQLYRQSPLRARLKAILHRSG